MKTKPSDGPDPVHLIFNEFGDGIVVDTNSGSGRVSSGLQKAGRMGAGIVAMAAVGLAVWEGLENRRHNRLSVVPNVDAVREFDMRAQTFTFTLMSSGLGPAVVRDMRVYVDDELVFDKDSTGEFAYEAVYPVVGGKNLDVWDSYYDDGHYLLPDNRYDLLRVEPRSDDGERIENFRDMADRINVVVCYCSVYGDQCARKQLHEGDLDLGRCPP